MTTKNSPTRALRAQADKIAALLKAAERGERIDVRFAAKITEARKTPSIKVGIVMDDKVLTPEIPWTTIRELPEAELSAWIVGQMKEQSGALNA